MSTEQRVRIVADTDPMDPREWDNVGRMICWHGRYNLGDEHDYDCDDFMRRLAFEACDGLEDRVYNLEHSIWDRLVDYIGCTDRAHELVDNQIASLIESAVRSGYVILPLYLYDHSGITMSTGQFACPWDSGQVGYIICDNETIEREWGGDLDLAEKCLRGEVSVYDDYITGNVYGFIVEERETCDVNGECDDWEEVDSCWGFYGRDPRTNGMHGYLSEEQLNLADDAEIEYPSH